MQSKTQHSIFGFTALLLVLALLLPASLSLIHSTQDHDHIDRCEMAADTHIHEKKLDCDFDDIVLHKLGVFAFAKAQLNSKSLYPTPIYNYTPWIAVEPSYTDTSRGPPMS